MAVAYTPAPARPAMRALLALDAHLSRLVAGTSEPMVGQIRLAWWREELAKPAGQRAAGSPELAMIGDAWTGEEPALIALVEGWEHLLEAGRLARESVIAFAAGRGTGFAALARLAGVAAAAEDAAGAGRCWALADLAAHTRDEDERALCRTIFQEVDDRGRRLPRVLRGLAVLGGLARRAILRGEPLLDGRGGALAALRLGLLGR